MYNEHVASFPGLSPHVACNWDKPGNEITSSAMSQAVDLEDIKLDSEAEHEASATDIEGGHTDAEENTDGGEPGETSTPPPEKKKKDPSTYTLVEAAQYGVLDRCRELVEHKRKDVTRGDEENITVLHWAAINNRIAVASYFIQKGADVNAMGGELKSAPIHWAARQGHLTMVILLMRYGANPENTDSEGLNCLHIAAQFGFANIVAYLISCHLAVPIDCRDKHGRTPLMLAAMRANRSYDPTRIIIALGADIRAVDEDNNSALHLAAENLNYLSLKQLIDAGAPMESQNKDGKTPYNLAMENQNRYGMDAITMGIQKKNPKNLWEYITRDPKVAWWVMLFAPAVFLALFGYLGVICPNWWTYLIATSIYGWLLKRFILLYVPAFTETNPLAFGLVLGTKVVGYISVMVIYARAGTLVHYYVMTMLFILLLYVFRKTWKSDPGHIPKCDIPQDAHKTIAQLCERGLFHSDTFCSTCLVRRPLRSKHCTLCNRCVARFDHHCPWIDNCVGLHNHKMFLIYLVFLVLMLTWGAKASLIYLYRFHPATHGNFLVKMWHYISVDPWVGFILIQSFVHLTWVYLLLVAQVFQLICQGMTTNEKRNAYRYTHFLKFGGSNPFHRGISANCADLFGFTCCQDRSNKVDWTKTYEIPKNFTTLAAELEDDTVVKIPMPYSSTWDPSQHSMHGMGNPRHGMGTRNGYVSSDDETLKEQFAASKEYSI